MRLQAEKWLLMVLCAGLSLSLESLGPYAVIPLIVAVVEAALYEALKSDRQRLALACCAALGAALYPPLYFYLPVFLYDLWLPKPRALLLCLLPGMGAGALLSGLNSALVFILMGIGLLMKYRALTLQARLEENHRLRDDAEEMLRELRDKNNRLLEHQEDVAKMAMLSERSRIARDIHDSVGHVLSSALLQTGAMMALADRAQERELLGLLNQTLGEGMNEVRSAIHQLRDESLNLREELERLARGFQFCPVTIECDVGQGLPPDVTQTFVFIVKEGLANVARHSDANRVHITAREHPAFYQLVVRDNGRPRAALSSGGMGLDNIRSRVEQLGGLARIHPSDEGFEIFVSVRKESRG